MGSRLRFAFAACVLLCWLAGVPLHALGDPEPQDMPAGPGFPEHYLLTAVSMTLEILHNSWAGNYVDTITITGAGEGRFQGRVTRARLPGVDTLTVLSPPKRVDQAFTVPCDSVLALLDAFYEADFFGLRPDYSRGYGPALLGQAPLDVGVATMSSCDRDAIRVSIQIGDYARSVRDGGFGPLDLQRLEERFLKIAGAERWTGPAERLVQGARGGPKARYRARCPDAGK